MFERADFLGVVDDRTRETPVGGTRKVRIRNYGGAVGYRVSDRLSIGAGLSLYQLRLDADFARFGIIGNFAGPPNLDLVTATTTQRSDDWTASFNAGALVDVTPRVKAGATFRRGPTFTFTQHDQVGDLAILRDGSFKVPDVLGLGVEWRTTDALRFVIDYDRVQYGQLKRDFIDFQALASRRPDRVRLDDGNELHVGVEYLLANAPYRWHCGAVSGTTLTTSSATSQRRQTTMSTGCLPRHSLAGPRRRTTRSAWASSPMRWLELNGAADLSSRTKYVTFSVVIRY